MMVQYLAAFHNEKGRGPVAQLFSDDEEGEIHAFVAKHDRPGFAVYRCVSPLKEGSTRRSLEDVNQIDKFCVDIDFKDLEEDPEVVQSRLLQLPLSPTLVLQSGGGLHLVFILKEPIYADEPEFAAACDLLKRLTRCLSGDPAPAHPAALLREINTHNTKRGDPVQVKPLWGSGQPVDISEIEALVDLLPDEGIFPRKVTNGRDPSPPAAGEYKAPIDVDERMANVQYEGPGENKVRWTELQVSASLLGKGLSVQETVDTLLDELRTSLADDPRVASWDWAAERVQVEKFCFGWIAKHPELSDRLPDGLREDFERKHEAGLHPRFVHAWHLGGWLVRGEKPFKQATGADGGPAEGAAPKASKAPRVRLRWFAPVDIRTLPPRRWLYGRHYQRGVVSATVAPGGTGKTSLVMVDAIAMATARNLLGDQPEERCRVWLHNGEDGQEELTRRICAICEYYKIPQEELDGWLAVTSGADMPLKVANGFSDLKIDASLVEEMTATVLEGEIDVVLLDPLVTLHSINESDNGKMDAVIRIFGRMADVCSCAVDLSHHTRKGPAGSTGDHTSDDARGASAIRDAVRMMRVLNIMSREDASSLGLDEFSRLSYFRVDRGKANTVPPAKSATWRKFESVHLANDDDVGVVAPWDHPDAEAATPERAAAERKAEEVFLQILRKYVGQGKNASVNRGPTHAPSLFAGEREAKLAKVSKVHLQSAMGRLLDAGKIVSQPTPNGRAHRLQMP